MSTTLVMDFKIRLKDENGNYYLFRPYLRANLDEVGNVMNYTIVGAAEKGSLNALQKEILRDMCIQITLYLGKLVRGGRNFFRDVSDYPSERQVRNLLSGRTRKSGMIFPLTGINLEQKKRRAHALAWQRKDW